jgi:hypothetical protein
MAFASLTKPSKVEAAGPDLSFFTSPPALGVKRVTFILLMQHVLETGKRAFSAAVAAATIAFSVGAGLLVSPASVSAASAGDLIKGTSLSTVYYYGYDGMRYVFPNEATYFTWYSNFNDVSTISDSALSDITLGGNVVMRPGSWWIKVQSIADVYAVARNGMIHWIETADIAEDLAGSDWNKRIVDVPDVFFADYTEGTSLMEAAAYEGALYEMGGTTYLSWDGEMREVTSAGMSANNFMSKFVLDGANIDDSDLTMGDEISSEMTSLVDAAQTETSDDDSSAMGDVEISAASSMPAGSTVTKGANGVEVFAFDVEAGSEEAVLDGVTLSLTGAGAASTLSAVYLYEGDTRLTDARSINSSTREVTFNSLDVELGARDSVTLTVKATVATLADAASTFGFELESADMVTASGDVSGRFPIEGDEFTVGGASSGTLTIEAAGSIQDPAIGEQDAEIAKFRLSAGTEDADVELITLEVEDAGDHSDFNLWDGSDWLAECENTSRDQVVCSLADEPFFIEEGDNNVFTLSADIGGKSSDVIRVYAENAVDILAIGGDYGFGMATNIEEYDDSACTSSVQCSYSVVQGGDVTLAFNGPAVGDIQIDAQDQTLLEFSITSAQTVDVKSMAVKLYSDDDADGDARDAVENGGDDDTDGLFTTGSVPSLTDIKVVDTDSGRTVGASLELTGTDDADETLTFTDDFTIEAGETLNLAVVADVDDLVGSGTIFLAEVTVSGLDIEDANGDTVTDIVPASGVVGFNQTARAASLAISLASTPVDTTTVQGTDSHAAVGFTFTAGDASDITVSEIVLSAYGDDDGDATFTIGGETNADVNDFIESCSLYHGSEIVGGPESPSSNGQTITFDSMDWMLDASEVATLTVKCNLANPSETSNRHFAFDIVDASSDVIAEDEDGDDVTATGDAVNGSATTVDRVVTIAASGSLAASAAADMPDADFLRTGTSNSHVATYRFTATNEDFVLNTLSFSEEQAEDDTGSSNSAAYANNISVVSLAWDGMTGTAPTAALSGNIARFSGLSIPVAVDEPTDVEVYVNVPTTDRVSGGSATSNEKVRMGLYTSGAGNTYFKATGSGSGSEVNGASVADLGDDLESTDGVPTFVVKETYPSVARSSSSPSTGVAGGRPEVLRFNVSATAGEDVVIDRIMFRMSASDVGGADWNTCDTASPGTYVKTGADFDIFDRSNLSTALDTASANWSLHKVASSEVVACDGTAADIAFVGVAFPTDEVVAAGTTKTYSLYMSAAGASTDDSVLFEIVSDPASTNYDAVADASAETSIAVTDTVITVDSGAAFSVGDIIIFDVADDGVSASDERMLVTNISTNDLTVVRGYLGTNVMANTGIGTSDDIFRLPTSFLWKDDGVAGATGTTDDWWGAYLVDITDFSGASSVQF